MKYLKHCAKTNTATAEFCLQGILICKGGGQVWQSQYCVGVKCDALKMKSEAWACKTLNLLGLFAFCRRAAARKS